jgi:hypothetical protein
MIDTALLPPELLPLWEAFREAMFSPRGKRTPLLEITVTVKAVEMESALKVVWRLSERDIEVG